MSDAKRALMRKQLVSAKYTDVDITLNELVNTISSYQNLKPKVESCKIPGIGKRNLMVLKGTIPVPYRANTYNIPVSLWVTHNHPRSAPLCWVNPTHDMTIKVSKNVDADGRIYLPYLSEWVPNSSDLLGAIQVMIITFSESMPLYSRPKGGPSVSVANPPVAASTATSVSSSQVNPPYPTNFGNTPAYPGYTNYPAVNPVTVTPYPSGQPSIQPPQPPTNSLPYSGYGGYTPRSMAPHQPAPTSTNFQHQSQSNFDTITPKHFRDSLETAVADEIKKNCKEIEETLNAEIQVLRKTADDLNGGRSRLDNLIKEMETKLVELSETKEKIHEKDRQIEQQLNKVQTSSDELKIDDCFGPVQPLYKQLINCLVEENAIVDAIYHLNHALQRGVIDINVFIKHVKDLSRRQFMMRALMKQCREKARLPA